MRYIYPMNTQSTNTVLEQILRRVQKRLDAIGLSESGFLTGIGVSNTMIRNWRRGAMPRIESLAEIAPALGTTPEWLAYEAGPETLEAAVRERPAILVPRVSWVSAGAFAISDTVMETDELDTIAVSGLPSDGEWYAFDIPEPFDSMDRISPPGSTIIVNRRDKRLVPNACYVITDGEGGATYKRYRPNPVRFEPVSTNPAHEPIFPDHGNMPGIFGRVRQSILNM